MEPTEVRGIESLLCGQCSLGGTSTSDSKGSIVGIEGVQEIQDLRFQSKLCIIMLRRTGEIAEPSSTLMLLGYVVLIQSPIAILYCRCSKIFQMNRSVLPRILHAADVCRTVEWGIK